MFKSRRVPVRPSTKDRPNCYGRSRHFEETDYHCRKCDWFQECGDEVLGKSQGGGRGSAYSPARKEDRGVEFSETEAADMQEGESPFERFYKDVATGACRGGMYEGYRFFCRFRF